MPFREKFTWVSLAATLIVAGAYVLLVLVGAGGVPVASIAYQVPMVLAVGVTIALTIVGTIVLGIGGGIAARLAGEPGFGDLGRVDDRDREIAQRGSAAGTAVASVGALVALALAMATAEQFWIANTLYLSFAAASVVAAAVRLVAYRRGLA